MSSLLRVRPTKIELIRLRRRLQLARKVHRILRERLTILINEFLTRVRDAYDIRLEIINQLDKIYSRTTLLYGIYGDGLLDYFNATCREPYKVLVGVENIMGVKTPSISPVKPKIVENALLPEFNELRNNILEAINSIVKLAQREEAIRLLGKEIISTKRKVNALEYILIPQIYNTIKYLRMKFEEREREEKARLKRVKTILSRRR